jgi:chemotaxis protein histidine kinase CheA
MQALLELPDETSPNEIDKEIIDIFEEEVEEVLNEMVTSFNNWKASPEDTTSLKTLQRNFHTIKGSGRLVGAMVIGELGFQFENLLDQIIEGTIPSNDAMSFLIEKVTHLLSDMVEQFKNHQPTSYEVKLLISQAHHLTETKGQSIGEFAPPGETMSVPFSGISHRLQRLARLTARELRKQVDFIINGEQIKVEETVLKRLIAPLEHILRDAIHGVEDAMTRQQTGKPANAKITLDISKRGTELIIKLSTDN